MRIVHVISNLAVGGAETSLCSLVEKMDSVDHTVISLLPHGVLRPRLERAGATVIELPGTRGITGALLLRSLARAVAEAQPDIVHAWMYHANVAVTALRTFAAYKCPSIWSVRQSLTMPKLEPPLTRGIIRLGALLSHLPDAVVYNSLNAALTHETIGFSTRRRWVVTNGVDCERFAPRPSARATLRAKLGLNADTVLIGRVARYSAMKDFDTLLRAFRKVLDISPQAHLLMVGHGINADNYDLRSLSCRHACIENVHFMEARLDIEEVYPGLDVLVSSSSANEGFPNVVAEALACGNLVAATAVGEELLVKEGVHAVVEPRNSDALAAAVLRLVGLSREAKIELGKRGRRFVELHFSLSAFAEKHHEIYFGLVENGLAQDRSRVAPC